MFCDVVVGVENERCDRRTLFGIDGYVDVDEMIDRGKTRTWGDAPLVLQ